MKRGLLGLITVLLCAVTSTVLIAEEERPDPVPERLGISRLEEGEYTVERLVVPGEIADWAAFEGSARHQTLVLAAREGADVETALRLWVWRIGEPGEWSRLEVDLPEQIDSIETFRDSESDSTPYALVFGESRLLIVALDGSQSTMVPMSRGFFPIGVSRWSSRAESLDTTGVYRRIGALERLRLDTEGTRFDTDWSIDIPLLVDRVWGGLRLETPPVVRLAESEGGRVQYMVGPEAHGLHRLRSLVVETGAGDAPSTSEVWSMFSGPETVLESWYVMFDQKPALLVTSVQADKHGVFEKKKLRLFPLDRDRSRAGSKPILEAVTRSRNWYGTCAGIADINRDTHDDVVSAQPQGLGAGKLWVAVYVADKKGGFESKPRGTMLKVSEGERCSLDVDFDLDGNPDLMVVENDSVLIFPLGADSGPRSREVVSQTPRWSIDLEDIRGRPDLRWIFDESKPQIVSKGRTEAGQGRLSVVRFRSE